MAEMTRPQSVEASRVHPVELPQFKHPLLQLVASARDLPPEFQAVSDTLGALFDTSSPQQERLTDALELEERVTRLSLGKTVQRLIMQEVWQTLLDTLPCAQLWERCALEELREERIDVGNALRDALPDLQFVDGSRSMMINITRILNPWTERLLTTPLEEYVHTIDDAQASIRLLRLAAMFDTKQDWSEEPSKLSKRQLALLGLWCLLEDHMRDLTSPPLAAGHRRKSEGKPTGPTGGRDARGVSDYEMFYPSYGPESRLKLLTYLLGQGEANAARTGHGNLGSDGVATGTNGGTGTAGGAGDAAGVVGHAASSPGQMHLVVTQDIPPISGREDKETLARFQSLRTPLPLPRLPDDRTLRQAFDKLHGEFPWATSAIQRIAGQLLARERSGSIELAWSPILLVGQPGCGKSRLARRLAEVFSLPFLPLPLAGAHDPKLLLGTARSWTGAHPSPLLQFMVTHRCARGVILLDEVEKTRSWDSGAGSIPSILLNLLEPETSKRWYDGFLQASCDLSKLLFIATANSLTGLSKPLLSRMEPVLVPEPQRAHFASVAWAVVSDIAAEWGVPEGAIDNIDIAGIAAAANNVRQLRLMMLRALADQAMTPRVLH